jgi:uncharacterized DUF497 family protein
VWIWDEDNARVHFVKHRVSFRLAIKVFDDPFQFSEPDPHEDGDRWQTLGRVGDVLLMVVHTEPVEQSQGADGEPVMVGRIISARKATPGERAIYANRAF